MKHRIKILILFLFASLVAQANETGVIVRLAPVYSDANSVSPVVGQISAGSRVTVFERKGGWKQIFSEPKSLIGWVRSYQVRENMVIKSAEIETEPDSRGFLSGLASFSRKASGLFGSGGGSSSTSSGTATIGVRGLSEAELKAAKPDPEELKKMQGFASNKTRAAVFARSGKLEVQRVEHFQKEKKETRKKTDK